GHGYRQAIDRPGGKRESRGAGDCPPDHDCNLRPFFAGRLGSPSRRPSRRLFPGGWAIQVLMKTEWRTNPMRSTILLVAAAITGCSSLSANDRDRQAVAETFLEPAVVASNAGVLRVSLIAKPSVVTVAGRRATVM